MNRGARYLAMIAVGAGALWVGGLAWGYWDREW